VVTGAALLAVGGKFAYDVYQEYRDKTGDHGLVNTVTSWGGDILSAGGVTYKNPWNRAVSSTANYLIKYTSKD
ncbi:MAG: hypothetical protein IKE41_04970, partial [Clostridia bacterium]|nr:hypothetical protein [Clostridia bacterium]